MSREQCGPIPEAGGWTCVVCGCRYSRPLRINCGRGGMTPGDRLRYAVRLRWRDDPAIRPMHEIDADIARQEAAGTLPTGCPDKLQRYVTALLARRPAL